MASSLGAGRTTARPDSRLKDPEERAPAQPDRPSDELQRARIVKILEIIESGKPCTVRGLATEFNLSESHLQHFFKQRTGLCLGRLLTEQKLQIAAQLLNSSQMCIKQIASAVGYQHTSSFTRAFERRFARSPWAYRKHNDPATEKFS